MRIRRPDFIPGADIGSSVTLGGHAPSPGGRSSPTLVECEQKRPDLVNDRDVVNLTGNRYMSRKNEN